MEHICFTEVPYFRDKALSVSPLLMVWYFFDLVDFAFGLSVLLSAVISFEEADGR
jgi:hypothetical protein